MLPSLKACTMWVLPLLARGEMVAKIEPGRYSGSTSTVGTLGWITIYVLPTKDDNIEARFLFRNSDETVRMPQGYGTVVLTRKRGNRNIRVPVGEREKVQSRNCWVLPKGKLHSDELRRVYGKFSIEEGRHMTSLFHLCWIPSTWVVFLGSESRKGDSIDTVSLPVIMTRKEDYTEQQSSRDAAGSISERRTPSPDVTAFPRPSGAQRTESPVGSTLEAPTQTSKPANDDPLRDTSTMVTEATPSCISSVAAACPLPLPGSREEMVNKIEPGRYVGSPSTAVGTLGWITMYVVRTAGDSIDAWFEFWNSYGVLRMPQDSRGRGHGTVALNRKRGHCNIRVPVGERQKIQSGNCWFLPKKQIHIDELRRSVRRVFNRERRLNNFLVSSLLDSWELVFLPVTMTVMVTGQDESVEQSSSIIAADSIVGSSGLQSTMGSIHDDNADSNIPSATVAAAGQSPLLTVHRSKPINTADKTHESDSQKDTGLPIEQERQTVVPAVGFYFNDQATEQLNIVSLKVSGGAGEPLLASLTLFCTTSRCSQSALGAGQREYFTRTSLGGAEGLAFTPPSLILSYVEESCLRFEPIGTDVQVERAAAFKDAGDAFQISNFMPATTGMCWSQDGAGWDLMLGMKIGGQGELSPDFVVRLDYADDKFTLDSSDGAEQLHVDDRRIDMGQKAQGDRVIGRKSKLTTWEREGAPKMKRAKTGP
ncbi:hypothetical protein FOZ60_001525 [Perkinsus olseni]|uniref:Uncharacterized protein n=1 Tax=Perkinsus olseni TaxID=32597 RepID=A0A7J6P157_PEROL|nr:hypothetical protein FOZ60_001525 [Perkinsus olseni]